MIYKPRARRPSREGDDDYLAMGLGSIPYADDLLDELDEDIAPAEEELEERELDELNGDPEASLGPLDAEIEDLLPDDADDADL